MIELVVGGTCLVLAGGVAVPGLTRVRDDAKVTGCAQNLGTINSALGMLQAEFPGSYAPLPDDASAATMGASGHFGRVATWIDLLQQRGYLASRAPGYCPADALPDRLNVQRGMDSGIRYPVALGGGPGMDHSYGVSVVYSYNVDTVQYPCWDPDADPSRRIMAGDGSWSWLRDLSARSLRSGVYYDPVWYSNTVGYRHKFAANLLHRDGHVAPVAFDIDAWPDCWECGVDTTEHYIWHAGEYVQSWPDMSPCLPGQVATGDRSADASAGGRAVVIPDEINPAWYTENHQWTIPDIMPYKGWTQN